MLWWEPVRGGPPSGPGPGAAARHPADGSARPVPRRAGGQSTGRWYFAAISRAASPSGPGCGTNTASR